MGCKRSVNSLLCFFIAVLMYLHYGMEIPASAWRHHHVPDISYFFNFPEDQRFVWYSHHDIMFIRRRHKRMIYRVAPVHDFRYMFDWLLPDKVVGAADIHERPFIHKFRRVNVSLKNVFGMRYFDAVLAFEYL